MVIKEQNGISRVGWANSSIVCPRRGIIGGQAKRRLRTLPNCFNHG